LSRRVLTVAVACAVPFALAGNALLLIAWGWLPRALYALPGFPDGDGLEGGERLALARTGVDSVQPWDTDGMDSLREATLPTGMPAFAAREIAHMQDVRGLMSGLLLVWAIALAILIAAWLATRSRPPAHAAVRAGLRAGALAAIALLAALGVFMLADFDAFFTAFHGLFFEGDSWRFAADDTLRRLYPYAFWGISGGVLAALTIGQALALARAARPSATTA
jgi:integral membrane protein (TIGR01906 family)